MSDKTTVAVLPDIESPGRAPLGSVGSLLRAKDARIRVLELARAVCERALLARRSSRRDEDDAAAMAARALGPEAGGA